MNLFRRHPVFATILAIFALIILGEAWYVYALRSEVAAAEREVQFRIAEIEQLQAGKPAPIDENLHAARDEFAANAEVLARMLRVLNVTGPDDLEFFKGEPTTRPDAWFEISQFVERMSKEAKTSEVETQPEERFGFSAYAFEGPEPTQIRAVYREHRIVEYLLGKLFAARPQALLGVQREGNGNGAAKPAGVAAPGPASARASGGPAAGAAEIFVIDPQVSARTPGYVDTLAFRIIFSGHTRALRGFMNALAAPDIPLVVRSVEVRESVSSTARPGGGAASPSRPSNPFSGAAAARPAPAATASTVPIVAENASIFTVTVEFFEVKIRAPESIATALNP